MLYTVFVTGELVRKDNHKCYNYIKLLFHKNYNFFENHLVVRFGGREVHAEFWLGNVKETDHFEERSVYRRIILKYMLKKVLG
jgi:hypothetical protein